MAMIIPKTIWATDTPFTLPRPMFIMKKYLDVELDARFWWTSVVKRCFRPHGLRVFCGLLSPVVDAVWIVGYYPALVSNLMWPGVLGYIPFRRFFNPHKPSVNCQTEFTLAVLTFLEGARSWEKVDVSSHFIKCNHLFNSHWTLLIIILLMTI